MAVPGAGSNSSLRWLAERSKHFGVLQSALDWIQDKSENVANAPFGDNRKCECDVIFKMHHPYLVS